MKKILVLIFLLNYVLINAAFKNFREPGESEAATCNGNCCTIVYAEDAQPGTWQMPIDHIDYHCTYSEVTCYSFCIVKCKTTSQEGLPQTDITIQLPSSYTETKYVLMCLFISKQTTNGHIICDGNSDDPYNRCSFELNSDPCSTIPQSVFDAAKSNYGINHPYTITYSCTYHNFIANNAIK